MRKILIALICLNLTACNPLEIASTVFQASTASISNPVTKEMLKGVEDTGIVIFAGLRAWKRSCVELAIPQSCRQQIKSVQTYTRKLPPLLADLRIFVKNNDQVNAVIAYNTIKNLYTDIKSIAAANNVQVQ